MLGQINVFDFIFYPTWIMINILIFLLHNIFKENKWSNG
jgi:hypothetical protein